MKDLKALLLAAGVGSRLKPLTDIWPKCLMPIRDRPLLEYWLIKLQKLGISDVLVNTHYLSEHVEDFLDQPRFKGWVSSVYEESLLGTAATVRENSNFCKDSTTIIAHADNWTCCDFTNFLYYHNNKRPKGTVMTMMTFTCLDPTSCGIVELDSNGVVVGFHEKVKNPPGKLANAAVYLVEPEVVDWIVKNPEVTDFSTEVLPAFIGKISTWHNKYIHNDIGTIEMLQKSQIDECKVMIPSKDNIWQKVFMSHPIHGMIYK